MNSPTHALKEYAIIRSRNGFILAGMFDGKVHYCGASREWFADKWDVGAPFRTFAGIEWYLQEWVVR